MWDLTSTGEWKKGPYAAKKFKDRGRLVEKPDNKADLELEIETDGVTDKIKTSATGLDKVKGGGKLKVTGGIDVTDDKGKTTRETLSIELDQATKTFTSQLKSPFGFLDFVVLKNTGTFTSVKTDGAYHGETAFDLTVTAVPEPSGNWLLLAGALVAAGTGLGSRRAAWPYSYL